MDDSFLYSVLVVVPMNDPDARDCPKCDEEFIVIDSKDWRQYTAHLESHIIDHMENYGI